MEYIIRKEDNQKFSVVKFEDEPIDTYTVRVGNKKWSCNCPHARYRHVQCKHIGMVKKCIRKGTPQPFSIELLGRN